MRAPGRADAHRWSAGRSSGRGRPGRPGRLRRASPEAVPPRSATAAPAAEELGRSLLGDAHRSSLKAGGSRPGRADCDRMGALDLALLAPSAVETLPVLVALSLICTGRSSAIYSPTRPKGIHRSRRHQSDRPRSMLALIVRGEWRWPSALRTKRTRAWRVAPRRSGTVTRNSARKRRAPRYAGPGESRCCNHDLAAGLLAVFLVPMATFTATGEPPNSHVITQPGRSISGRPRIPGAVRPSAEWCRGIWARERARRTSSRPRCACSGRGTGRT